MNIEMNIEKSKVRHTDGLTGMTHPVNTDYALCSECGNYHHVTYIKAGACADKHAEVWKEQNDYVNNHMGVYKGAGKLAVSIFLIGGFVAAPVVQFYFEHILGFDGSSASWSFVGVIALIAVCIVTLIFQADKREEGLRKTFETKYPDFDFEKSRGLKFKSFMQ